MHKKRSGGKIYFAKQKNNLMLKGDITVSVTRLFFQSIHFQTIHPTTKSKYPVFPFLCIKKGPATKYILQNKKITLCEKAILPFQFRGYFFNQFIFGHGGKRPIIDKSKRFFPAGAAIRLA